MRGYLASVVLLSACGAAGAPTAPTEVVLASAGAEADAAEAEPPAGAATDAAGADATGVAAGAEVVETDEERSERERLAAARDARAEALFLAAEAERGPRVVCDSDLRLLGATRVSGLAHCIRDLSIDANRVRDAYNDVLAEGSPRWSIAALVRQAEAYDHMRVLLADFALPDELERIIADADPATRQRLRAEASEAVLERIGPELGIVRCLALARYVLAVRAATAARLRTPFVDLAADRIATFDDATVGACVETMRSGDAAHGIAPDPSFAPWDPAERRAFTPANGEEEPDGTLLLVTP